MSLSFAQPTPLFGYAEVVRFMFMFLLVPLSYIRHGRLPRDVRMSVYRTLILYGIHLDVAAVFAILTDSEVYRRPDCNIMCNAHPVAVREILICFCFVDNGRTIFCNIRCMTAPLESFNMMCFSIFSLPKY